MKVFKFGGASVSSAPAIRNVASILEMYPGKKVMVISAMGSTTNELELLVRSYYKKDQKTAEILNRIKDYHSRIIAELGVEEQNLSQVTHLFADLEERLQRMPSLHFDYEYDQIVCFGELISTAIVSAYLNQNGIPNKWIDVRDSLRTDETYREAIVDWKWSAMLVNNSFALRNPRLLVIDGGHWLLVLLLMGAIIGGWGV